MPAKKTLKLAKSPKRPSGKLGIPIREEAKGQALATGKIEIAPPSEDAQKISADSVYLQEEPKEQVITYGGEETKFVFNERERLITTFTAGGVVLSFGLSIGSVIIFPVWGYGGGLLATLGIISCFGAFMARETI